MDGPLQLQEERKEVLALLVSAKEAHDRDGDLTDGPALRGQEGVGEGPLTPNLALFSQGDSKRSGTPPSGSGFSLREVGNGHCANCVVLGWGTSSR